jgi:hypothetical protein
LGRKPSAFFVGREEMAGVSRTAHDRSAPGLALARPYNGSVERGQVAVNSRSFIKLG